MECSVKLVLFKNHDGCTIPLINILKLFNFLPHALRDSVIIK